MNGLEQGILVCGLCRHAGKCFITSEGYLPQEGACEGFDKTSNLAEVIEISRGHLGLSGIPVAHRPVLTRLTSRRRM